MDPLKEATFSVLIEEATNDSAFGIRLEKIKEKIGAITGDYEKRLGEIERNDMKFSQEGLADQKAALSASIGARLREVRDGFSFKDEIAETEEELNKIKEPTSEIGQLIQLLKMQELRAAMTQAGDRFQELFLGRILDGDPDVIGAIEGSPLPYPVDPDVLQKGKKMRLELLNPVAAKKLKSLRSSQEVLENMIAATTPRGGERDLIAELSRTEPEGD